MEKEMLLVRIYLSEADQGKRHDLLDEIMKEFKKSGAPEDWIQDDAKRN